MQKLNVINPVLAEGQPSLMVIVDPDAFGNIFSDLKCSLCNGDIGRAKSATDAISRLIFMCQGKFTKNKITISRSSVIDDEEDIPFEEYSGVIDSESGSIEWTITNRPDCDCH
jgi:hypothetical protein